MKAIRVRRNAALVTAAVSVLLGACIDDTIKEPKITGAAQLLRYEIW